MSSNKFILRSVPNDARSPVGGYSNRVGYSILEEIEELLNNGYEIKSTTINNQTTHYLLVSAQLEKGTE